MINPEQAERIRMVIEKMLDGRKPLPPNALRPLIWYARAYIDTSRPSIANDRKALKEVTAQSKKAVKLVDDLNDLLDHMDSELRSSIDGKVREAFLDSALSVSKIAANEGALKSIKEQLQTLLVAFAQESARYSAHSSVQRKPGRSRDEYAHKIASELAELYARETGSKPTVSMTPIGEGEPVLTHGKYSKALAEIFEILGIKTGPTHPARQAAERITPEKLEELATEHQRRVSACRAASIINRPKS